METRKKVASSTTNLHQDRDKDSKFLAEYKVVYQNFNDSFHCLIYLWEGERR